MTRKDFQLVAEVLSSSADLDERTVRTLTLRFANRLAQEHAGFKRVRFLMAATPDSNLIATGDE